MRIPLAALVSLSLSLAAAGARSQAPSKEELVEGIAARIDDWVSFYKELHLHPELSFFEKETAARLAQRWRALGAEVTEGVGGHGIVGVVRNGEGPTVLLRTDLDALPIREQTGLAYASGVTTELEGKDVGVMHACGHDAHMTFATGTLEMLLALRDRWRGTVVLVGQPAEERGAGAKAMLAAGLYERFPRPDAALAIHVDANLPAGHVGFTSGWMMANVDAVDIRVRGRGGHGAAPHETRDPVVLAARIVMALQTIVSRELAPTDPAVVTVGSIHGGSKHNLIPDLVELQLTVRTCSDETRAKVLAAIERTCKGCAEAAGFPAELAPQVSVRDESNPALYNDPALVARVMKTLRKQFEASRVHERKTEMIGEDFALYARVEPPVPIFMFRIGTVGEERWQAAQQPGAAPLPGLHNSHFAPDPEPTLAGGVRALTLAALEILAER
jgi:hippurate hydrolase